mgnify:CR=1 FL=1
MQVDFKLIQALVPLAQEARDNQLRPAHTEKRTKKVMKQAIFKVLAREKTTRLYSCGFPIKGTTKHNGLRSKSADNATNVANRSNQQTILVMGAVVANDGILYHTCTNCVAVVGKR